MIFYVCGNFKVVNRLAFRHSSGWKSEMKSYVLLNGRKSKSKVLTELISKATSRIGLGSKLDPHYHSLREIYSLLHVSNVHY